MNLKIATRTLFSISIPKFIYYNFLCSRIHRVKGKFIIPYRGTRISIAKTARINANGHLFLNGEKLKHSRQECLVLLRDGATWNCNGSFFMYYGTTLQIHKNATLTTGDNDRFNTGSTIICANKMTIGDYVSTARGVFIFDSDHHPIFNGEGKRINEAKEVIIGNHVWMGLKSTIMKGAVIGEGSVIGAHSLVSGEMPAHCMIASVPARPVMKDISWER